MKNIHIIAVIFAVISLTGCSEDFLTRNNPNEMTTTDFWKTGEDLQKGIDAAYRPLRFNGVYARWLHILYVSRSDEGYSESPNPIFSRIKLLTKTTTTIRRGSSLYLARFVQKAFSGPIR
jgi:hypothetical protein